MNVAQTKGFTLLEVLVALTIFSLLALATGRATRMHLTSWSILEQKSLAGIVASNRMENARAPHHHTQPEQWTDEQSISGLSLRADTTIDTTDVPGYLSIVVDVYPNTKSSSKDGILYQLESGKYVSDKH